MLLTLVVTSCCIIAISSASKIEGEQTLKTISIHYNNCKKYHSVEEQDIMDLVINRRHIDIKRTPLSKLDVRAMEKTIMANPWMANAQVFVDNERVLHMYVTQRIPVVRVFQENGASYYMDTTMSIIPLSSNYIYYSTVVTNVPEIKNDSIGWLLRKDILSLVKKIRSDSFWSAQISHLIVDSVGAYELVPILGDHKILIGDANNITEKFNNLFVFYKNVLNRIGWDKYEVLDVRFDGQVVASPSLPYSGPVDKAANTINWVNSIIETEAKSDSTQTSAKQNELKKNYKDVPVVRPARQGSDILSVEKKDNKSQKSTDEKTTTLSKEIKNINGPIVSAKGKKGAQTLRTKKISEKPAAGISNKKVKERQK